MGNPNTKVPLFGNKVIDHDVHFFQGTIAAGTVTLELKTKPARIDSIFVKTNAASGATCELRINNVPVQLSGGDSLITSAANEVTETATSANVHGDGSELTLIITAPSGTNLRVTVKRTRME